MAGPVEHHGIDPASCKPVEREGSCHGVHPLVVEQLDGLWITAGTSVLRSLDRLLCLVTPGRSLPVWRTFLPITRNLWNRSTDAM
jgi:hypothetical protein